MRNAKDLSQIIESAKPLAESLLNKKPTYPRDLPNTQGVYLIYHKNRGIMYVGKAKNLRRRINDDHISGELKISTSTFRRKVHKVYGIIPGKEMRSWVIKNCSFTYAEIENPDVCSLVEVFLITFLRAKGESLLNN